MNGDVRTPCQRVPELFKLVRDSDQRRLNQIEKRSALWLCRTRCPRLTECGSGEPLRGFVWAGRVVTDNGTIHEGVTTARQDKSAGACRICSGVLSGKRRTYCSPKCASKRRNVVPVAVPESTTKAEVEGAFAGTLMWGDLHRPAREEIVRRLNAAGEDDIKIAARFPGVTGRIIKTIRRTHLGLPGHQHYDRVAV